MRILSKTEQQQLIEIKTYVQNRLINDTTGHDWQHILRVVALTKQLAQGEQVPITFDLLAAGYLHDVIDTKLVADGQLAQNQLRNFLTEHKVAAPMITQIFDIITHLSFSDNLTSHYQLSSAGQLVQDADRLDALGAIGIGRTFYYGGSKGNPMYNPNILPRTGLDKIAYRNESTVINHFYEKLFKLSDLMNTKTAKQIAQQRTNFMKTFVQTFKQEWESEEQ